MASPIGHAAVGVAAAAVAAGVTGTPDSAALWIGAVIASGLPDLDVAFPLLGFSKRYHRNATHSLVSIAGLTLAGLALIHGAGLAPARALAPAWIAALFSHPLLDVLTTGPKLASQGWGIPLFWPISRRRFSLPRAILVSDRPESHTVGERLEEMREDLIRIVPGCALVVLISRLWP